MIENRDYSAEEMLAPAQKQEGARVRPGVTGGKQDEYYIGLSMPPHENTIQEEMTIPVHLSAIDVIHGIGGLLSVVIRQARSSLMQKSGIGFHEPGFEPLSVRDLVSGIEAGIECCQENAANPMLPAAERIASITFIDVLEDFQCCFFGLDFDSLGRSEVSSLLPAFEKFKQILMKIELEMLLAEQQSAQAKQSNSN